MNPPKRSQVHQPPAIIMIASFKGGCGKTMLAQHLAVRAKEAGRRVLVVDTDAQGDVYRRLLGDDANTLDCPPEEWAPGCLVVHSPGTYAIPAGIKVDLVVVDTAPQASPPDGPTPTLLLIPIDGVDAARNSNETIAWSREQHVGMTVLVFNGVDEGGKLHARQFEKIKQHLPEGVTVLNANIPRGGSIKRSASSCTPAWDDMWAGRDAGVLRVFCDAVLGALASHLPAQKVPPSPRRGATAPSARAVKAGPGPAPKAARGTTPTKPLSKKPNGARSGRG